VARTALGSHANDQIPYNERLAHLLVEKNANGFTVLFSKSDQLARCEVVTFHAVCV
jgi:hypothetical protein